MGFEAKILADSLSPDGVRLTTFEITFPRIILAEFNTHRMFSRNSASSRAIPVEKMIKMVRGNPYVPSSWGKNQKGMSASEEVSAGDAAFAYVEWLMARDMAVQQAQSMAKIGIHKQLTNRLLEPFMWHTCIVSATEFLNYFHLRNNAQAHPDIQTIARMMQELYESGMPAKLDYGQWHLPLLQGDAQNGELGAARSAERERLGPAMFRWQKISVARCARVSYLTHDGKRDEQADLDLHDKLLQSGHLSPFEHVARPASGADDEAPWATYFGNFRGWIQYRKLIQNEADILGTAT